jgi:protoporphyrinogen/coproporphyrinogen III oxidase
VETETRDVVVIGGGIAGLAAAWRLRERDVLLLEAGDRLGGRLRSDPRGAYWLNYGAHLFPGPGSLVNSLARECALALVPVTGGMMGMAVGSTVLTRGRVESYPFRLPLSLRDRVAFAAAGVRLRRAVTRYRRLTARGPGESAGDVRARTLAFEDQRTFKEFLGPLPPRVEAIFSCAAHRASAELSELSAGCGIGLFALVWSGKGSLIARNLLGGAGDLPSALGERLGSRVRTGCRVTALHTSGEGIVVEHETGAVRARHVVVAVQAPFAAPLVERVDRDAASALSKLTYGAFLVVAVETNERGAMPWDDVYAIATPGRAFDMFVNQAQALRDGGVRKPGGSLMLFAGARAAAALSKEADAVIVERFLADLHRLYPQSRAVIADATVRRWEFGNVFARPGRQRLQAALEGGLGPRRNVHLAGDYCAELGTIEAAARTGQLAAERVDAELRTESTTVSPPPEVHCV